MRITSDYKKNKMLSGVNTLKDASETAPRTKGYYTLALNGESVYVDVAEEGLREEFIKLYNGFHMEGEVSTKVYENREDIVVEWAQEFSLEKAEEIVAEMKSVGDYAWN